MRFTPFGSFVRFQTGLIALVLATALPGCATQADGLPAPPAEAAIAPAAAPAAAGAIAAPATAGPVPGPYDLQELRGGLYRLGDGMYDMMFLVHANGVILVDAPPTLGPHIVPAVRSVTAKPVTHLVYTHDHTDHIGAAARVLADAKAKHVVIAAHAETAATLRRRNDPRRPVPTVAFDDRHVIDVGGQRLELAYHGPNHTAGNLFVYAPVQRTLMLVDVVYPGWVPFKNLGIAKDVPGYVAAHERALAYDFDTLVAGHVDRAGTRQDVERSLRFVRDLQDTARRAGGTLPFGAYAVSAGTRDPWALYNGYQRELVRRCVAELAPRWSPVLKGCDTYLPDDCWQMVEALSVDFAPEGEMLRDAGTPASRPAPESRAP